MDDPLETKSEITTSKPRYEIDFQYTQELILGNTDAWNKLYKEFRKKLEIYIKRKYPNVFTDIAVEEICDGVMKRLIENDYKALRSYRGECTFSTYITKAADWEIKDWLRKHSNELFTEHIDTLNAHDPVCEDKDSAINSPRIHESEEEIPETVKSLSDDLRWAFLLRYYDYFGFPLEEIRLLAKENRVLIGSITEKIVKFLEPEGQDILKAQREKQMTFQLRLQKLCFDVQKLNQKEQELLAEIEETTLHYGQHDEEKSEELESVRSRRNKLEEKRKTLLKNKIKLPITTPYEIIAEILGENNVSTIRSRVFLAKKQLEQKLFKKDK